MKAWFKRPESLVLLCCLGLYLPFMGEAVLRTTGDEKVYVAQALEMSLRSSWFVQTLAEVPNYYKGPLHYILLRIGYSIFGTHSLWSALWMNLLSLSVAAWALTRSLRLLWQDESAALTAGLGLVLAPGIFAHAFASQMEVELTAVYAIVLALCLRLKPESPRAFATWIAAWFWIGLASWLKSPLHSALLGVGLGGYCFFRSSWRQAFLGKVRFYLAPLFGVIVGGLAYAIPWLLDPEAFYRTYILRETVGKGPNGVGIWESILPNLSYHLWPVFPLLLVGLLALIPYVRSSQRRLTLAPGMGLALALALPTFGFFAWHPYRSEIYSLPAIPCVLVLVAGLGKMAGELMPQSFRRAQLFTLGFSFVPTLLVLALHLRFFHRETWWPASLLPVVLLCLFVQVFGFLAFRKSDLKRPLPAYSLMLWWPAWGAIAMLMVVLGQEDYRELRQLTQSFSRTEVFGFYNAQHFVWSEWGLLNLTSGLKVKGLHSEAAIKEWLEQGHPLIVSSEEDRSKVKALLPDAQLVQWTWSRWASHGIHTPERNPRIAWQKADLSLLRQEAFVLQKEVISL